MSNLTRVYWGTSANAEQEVGNGALTENEERAHMGIWALAKSPIILGTDLSKIKTSSLNILKNKVCTTLLILLQDGL